MGGCHNHRTGLYDGILIKENHIMAAGSIQQAIQQSRMENPDMPVEIEVENESQIRQALEAGAERLLLDNFPLPELKQAVKLVDRRAELEASGGITLENLREVALAGVDFISVGTLTKNVQAIDLSMRFEKTPDNPDSSGSQGK
jgi:nicotinate-nucleotide pyrophosphorylase (carboxylating)